MLIASITLSLLAWVFHAKGGQLDMFNLMAFCLVFGMVGSFMSLFLSKGMAKRSMNVQVIDVAQNESEQWLLRTVKELADKAGIGMPEVGVFSSYAQCLCHGLEPQQSAGCRFDWPAAPHEPRPSQKRCWVTRLPRCQRRHGDADADSGRGQRLCNVLCPHHRQLCRSCDFENENDGPGLGYFIATIVAEILLGILASIIVAWFSRRREFRADQSRCRFSLSCGDDQRLGGTATNLRRAERNDGRAGCLWYSWRRQAVCFVLLTLRWTCALTLCVLATARNAF